MDNTHAQDDFQDDNEGHLGTREKNYRRKDPTSDGDVIWGSTWRDDLQGGAPGSKLY